LKSIDAMSDPAPDKFLEDAGRSNPPSPGGDLEELRELLLGKEKAQISVIRERLTNPVLLAQDVSQVLPDAISMSGARSDHLSRALTPAVEAALKESIQRHPSVLVNAIFPVMGPAIRKALAEAFNKLAQSINQTLDHSLTLRGLKWRLEAFRTGKTFAEVVLYHTLIYRVEQVFLIHKKTGLLLQHVSAADARSRDADIVSGMLTAIQDFVQDSFQIEQGDALQTMQVGELNVWLESGPQATLAAVIRGHAPHDLRTALQRAIEKIHHDQAAAFNSFNGENSLFEAAHQHLESCLLMQFGEQSKRTSRKLALVVALLLAAAIVWGYFFIRENRLWASYLARLKAEDGIVVTEAGKHWGRFYVAGLLDPLSPDPVQLLPGAGLNTNRVVSHWRAYQSLSPSLILQRARQKLRPPDGVTLSFKDGVLCAEGAAPRSWVEPTRKSAELLAGVSEFKAEHLLDDSLTLHESPVKQIESLVKQIEKTILYFEDGVRLVAGQETTLETLKTQLSSLFEAASRAGKTVGAVAVGHTDKTGTEPVNLLLSQQRAEEVVSLLVAKGVKPAHLTAQGRGAREPLRAGLNGPEEALNRRVSFRVSLDETPTLTSPR
jgi:outer membrane protein OmpA-like peptidoglycan-associated protein